MKKMIIDICIALRHEGKKEEGGGGEGEAEMKRRRRRRRQGEEKNEIMVRLNASYILLFFCSS